MISFRFTCMIVILLSWTAGSASAETLEEVFDRTFAGTPQCGWMTHASWNPTFHFGRGTGPAFLHDWQISIDTEGKTVGYFSKGLDLVWAYRLDFIQGTIEGGGGMATGYVDDVSGYKTLDCFDETIEGIREDCSEWAQDILEDDVTEDKVTLLINHTDAEWNALTCAENLIGAFARHFKSHSDTP